jgi:hypothetical protein
LPDGLQDIENGKMPILALFETTFTDQHLREIAGGTGV